MQPSHRRRHSQRRANVYLQVAVAAQHDVLAAGQRQVNETDFTQMLDDVDDAVEAIACIGTSVGAGMFVDMCLDSSDQLPARSSLSGFMESCTRA